MSIYTSGTLNLIRPSLHLRLVHSSSKGGSSGGNDPDGTSADQCHTVALPKRADVDPGNDTAPAEALDADAVLRTNQVAHHAMEPRASDGALNDLGGGGIVCFSGCPRVLKYVLTLR
jgi:hypothetical protein